MPDQLLKRGAIPSPRSALAAATPHVALAGAPATFLTKPQRISMWGNDVHGDCVTAEEAFAKACNSPEIFITDDQVIAWATRHGVLEGAYLTQVLGWMQNDGFADASNVYDDGPYLSVNWKDPATLQSAIATGPVKIGVAADQLETAWHSTGGRSGWFGTGFHNDSNEDHCVALCGYGSIAWLAQQLGVQVPAGINGAQAAYALFTWNSIGIIDAPSMVAITEEAWLRRPTTVIVPAGLPTGPTATGAQMRPGEILSPGQSIASPNGRYRFIYQGDGNLVLYDGGRPTWASNTAGKPTGVCIMQGDGNLVIYDPGPHPIWASNTNGHNGSGLVLQDDGNVVIYDPGGHAVWATNTWVPTGPRATGSQMRPGQTLAPGQQIASASDRYVFIYQGDGNLVLYDLGHPIWASNTAGKQPGVCIMQGDGNLVVYSPGGHAVWASNTNGRNGSGLVAQDDGNVVIYDPGGHAVWATNTWVPTGPTATGSQMRPGQALAPGQQIASASGRYRFIYQGDGNLVLYDGGRATWASNTAGKAAGVAIMQGDGNLVIYTPGPRAIWASNTAGHNGSGLVVQDDGNTVIYDPGGHAIWATNTWVQAQPVASSDEATSEDDVHAAPRKSPASARKGKKAAQPASR
jgi:hypothetical protein